MKNVLDGVKVLDMCVAAAGPSCSRMLVDFGATDIMVEPLEGQSTRYTAPHSFHFKCSGKKSIVCNLKTPEGHALFERLVRWADVFVSNYRTAALERLGLSYARLHEINPRLVYGHISGFGEVGPEKDAPGFDITAWWSKSGMIVDMAQKGSIVQVPYALGDFSAGQSLALGICAGLYHRERTGEGIEISTSLMASGIFLNYDAIIESQYGYQLPTTRKHAIRAMLNAYRCKDGEWITINATHHWDTSWPCICKAIGREDLIERYTCNEDTMWDHAAEVIELLDEGFAKLTQQEAYDALIACGTISVEKVQHSADVASDPQAIANQFVYPWADPSGKTIMHPATPVRIGDYEPAKISRGPGMGEHTEEIMALLGYSEQEILDYERRNIVKGLTQKVPASQETNQTESERGDDVC